MKRSKAARGQYRKEHLDDNFTVARTTPAVRAEIAASTETDAALARRFGITVMTVRK